MIESAATILGVLGGVIISSRITDETQWYAKWFLWSAVAFFLASLVTWLTVFSPPLFVGFLLVFGFGLCIYALSTKRAWLLSLSLLGMLLIPAPTYVAGILLVALIPASGYLWHYNLRKDFFWFLAIPIIIIGRVLLF